MIEFLSLFEEERPLPVLESVRAWLSPDGRMLPVSKTHEEDAPGHGFKGSSDLYKKGWLRVVSYGSDAIMANTEGGRGITRRQEKELIDTAIEQGVTHVLFDNGNSYKTIWVDEDKMMLSESILQENANTVKALIKIVSKWQEANPYPDYGQLYWNEDEGKAIYNVGDGQEGDLDALKEEMSAVDGVNEVEVDAEVGMPEGFKRVWSQHD